MKILRQTGMALVFCGLGLLILLLNINHYSLTEKSIRATIEDSTQADALTSSAGKLLNKNYDSKFSFAKVLNESITKANEKIEVANNGDEEENELDSTAQKNEIDSTDTADEKDTANIAANISDTANANAGADAVTQEDNGTDAIDTDIVTLLVKNSIKGPLEKNNSLFLWLNYCAFFIGQHPLFFCTLFI